MRQCLDEATLQSYFDGELSTSMMESATSHLASCVACSAAARELEEENALLSEAFAMEFAESVPTERLRRRIDAAVSGLEMVRPVVLRPNPVSGFFSSIASLFSLSPQRAIGYAALLIVLAFGVIFGIVKFNHNPQGEQARNDQPQPAKVVQPKVPQPNVENVVAKNEDPGVEPVQQTNEPVIKHVSHKRTFTPKKATPKAEPVKLLPGERSYLQTIAKLDSTIREGQKDMRPALQAEYQRNLAVVDRAIAATRTAAKKNPSDPDAADFMFAAYQSKVDLLNTIADARVYNRTH